MRLPSASRDIPKLAPARMMLQDCSTGSFRLWPRLPLSVDDTHLQGKLMFGIKEKLASLPAWLRVSIALPVVVVCAWGTIKLTVFELVENGVMAMTDANQVDYDSTFFRLNGDFGMEDVTVMHLIPDGRQVEYKIDRVVVHTPGLAWLLKNSWYRTGKNFPDRFGLTLENARNSADTPATPGNYSNLPYDAIGCGVDLLTPAEFASMGFPALRRDYTGTITRVDDRSSKVNILLDTDGVGELALDFDLEFARPVEWEMSLQAFMDAPVRTGALTMRDTGFVEVRNRYCAKKAGLAESDFDQFHMQAMATRLQKEGLSFGQETLERYREFARDGGELQITTLAMPKITMFQFMNLGRFRQLQLAPARIRKDEGPLAPFLIQEGADPQLAARLEATAKRPLAAASNVAVPLAPASAVPVADGIGSEVGYRDLQGMIGAHLQVSTTLGTIRRGILTNYGTYMSYLKLDAEEGGFTLAIPADTIVQIRQIPGAPSVALARGAADAKAH